MRNGRHGGELPRAAATPCSRIGFSVGGFTNLTQDHLDYHGDMEQYFAAKRRLFTDHNSGNAVVNSADPYGQRLADEFAAQTVGDTPTADLFH